MKWSRGIDFSLWQALNIYYLIFFNKNLSDKSWSHESCSNRDSCAKVRGTGHLEALLIDFETFLESPGSDLGAELLHFRKLPWRNVDHWVRERVAAIKVSEPAVLRYAKEGAHLNVLTHGVMGVDLLHVMSMTLVIAALHAVERDIPQVVLKEELGVCLVFRASIAEPLGGTTIESREHFVVERNSSGIRVGEHWQSLSWWLLPSLPCVTGVCEVARVFQWIGVCRGAINLNEITVMWWIALEHLVAVLAASMLGFFSRMIASFVAELGEVSALTKDISNQTKGHWDSLGSLLKWWNLPCRCRCVAFHFVGRKA